MGVCWHHALKRIWLYKFVTKAADMLQDMVLHSCDRAIRKTLGNDSEFPSMFLRTDGSQYAGRFEVMAEYVVIAGLLGVSFAVID